MQEILFVPVQQSGRLQGNEVYQDTNHMNLWVIFISQTFKTLNKCLLSLLSPTGFI